MSIGIIYYLLLFPVNFIFCKYICRKRVFLPYFSAIC